VTVDPDQPTYTHGTEVELTMGAVDPGWTFTGWSGGGCSGTDPCTVTMNADTTVTANFTEDTYTLDLAILGNGSVGIAPEQATYTYGTVVHLTAITASDSTFTGWTGSCRGTETTCSVTMDGNKSVTANFSQNTYALDVTIDGGGSVVKDPDATTYAHGTTVTLTPVAEAGYTFSGWAGTNVDDLVDTGDGSWSIVMGGPKSISASFTIETFTMSYTAGAGGTLTGETIQTISYGGNGTPVEAVPDTGYHFVDWSDDSTANPRTETNVTADVTVTANFALDTHTLTVNQPVVGGTITPPTDTYDYGTVLELTATPAEGYHFVEWTGACSGSGACSVTMNADKTVGATFAINTYTLTVEQPAGGTITPATADYEHGTEVTLTAAPLNGYQLVGWTGACSGASPTCRVTMNGAKNVGAIFALNTYDLMVEVVGSGAVIQSPLAGPYEHGTTVILTPAADAGYRFSGWSGTDAGDLIDNQDGSWSMVMDEAKSLTATFELIPPTCYTLTLSHTGEGSDPAASPAKSAACSTDGAYVAGENITLSGAMPAAGWEISGWSGTADDASKNNANTMTMPAADQTAAVNYSRIQYTLTVISQHGTVGVNQPAPYYYSDQVILTMETVAAGWTFTGWDGGGCSGSGPCTVTINGDLTITANFTQNEYALNLTDPDGGAITATPPAPYYLDAVVTLNAAADPGWTFAAWTGDCAGQGNPCTLRMDAEKTVSASFTQNQYHLTVVSDHGIVSLVPNQETYTYNQTVLLTMRTVDPGWTFSGWSGGGCSGTGACQVMITADTTVTAAFTQDEYSLDVFVDPADSGNTVGRSLPGPYNYGNAVTLTPVTQDGWQFDHWLVGETELTDNPLDLTITGNMVATAYFEKIEYTLSVTADPEEGGAVTPNKPGPYYLNDVVLLTAVVTPGYTITGWSEAACGAEPTCPVTITGNTSVIAFFEQEQYELTIVTEGNGAVSKDPDQPTYSYGQTVTLNASADLGWTFAGWGDDGLCSGNGDCQVTLYGDTTVTASFTEDAYELEITWIGNGSVSADPQGPYSYGQEVTLTADPDEGWVLSEWSVEGCTGLTCTVTMYGNQAVIVTFTEYIEYNLTITQVQGGTIAADPAGPYPRDTMVQVSATPDPGWEFDAWTDACAGQSNPCWLTMDSDKTVSAVFKQPQGQLLPQNLISNPGTLREGFENRSDWTVTGSGAGYSAALDTVNVKDGSGSIKLTTPASGSVIITKPVTWDLSADQGNIRLWVYVSGTSEPSGGSLTLSSNASFTNYFTASYGGAFKLRYKPGWNLISLRTSDWKATGSPNWANIARIRIRLDSRSINTYSFDALTSGVEAMPAVVFTFDKGLASLYSQAFSIMQSRNVRGTGYIPTDLVGTSGQVTWSQLLEMYNAGWTIGNGSKNNIDLTTLSLTEQQAALAAAHDALIANGILNADYVAYPAGKYNADTLAAMANLSMRTGRSLLTFNNLSPLASPFEIAQRTILKSTSLSTAESWVNTAIARQEILVITIQGLSSTPGTNDWYISRFQSLVDYCIGQGIPIITMDDLYQLQSGDITIPLPAAIPGSVMSSGTQTEQNEVSQVESTVVTAMASISEALQDDEKSAQNFFVALSPRFRKQHGNF
jgi:uncharacterized repeat protein (TIGR02543 family)